MDTMIHSPRLGVVFFSRFAVHLLHFRLELVNGTFQRGFESEGCPCAYQTQAQVLSHEKSLKRGRGGLLIDKTQSAAFTVYFLPRDKLFFFCFFFFNKH